LSGWIACKNGVGVVVSLKQGEDWHMVQLMPVPLCLASVKSSFAFLVTGSPA